MAPRRPRPPPASTSNPTSSASSSSFFPPSSVSQLKYALFSWPNNPVTKRDPIAQTYFKSSCQMSNFASTLGGSFPLQLYQGSLGPGKPVELFLSGEQCQILMNGLIEKMGPTRAKQTWKKDAIHYLSELKDLKPILYKDQQAIEKHFVELKDQNDRYETKGRFESLIRMQEILEVIRRDLGEGQVDGEARFIAIDIETWERNHDKVTEVGFAKSVWKKGQFEEMEVKHFGTSNLDSFQVWSVSDELHNAIVVQENADLRNGRFCPDARDVSFCLLSSQHYTADSLHLQRSTFTLALPRLSRQTPSFPTSVPNSSLLSVPSFSSSTIPVPIRNPFNSLAFRLRCTSTLRLSLTRRTNRGTLVPKWEKVGGSSTRKSCTPVGTGRRNKLNWAM